MPVYEQGILEEGPGFFQIEHGQRARAHDMGQAGSVGDVFEVKFRRPLHPADKNGGMAEFLREKGAVGSLAAAKTHKLLCQHGLAGLELARQAELEIRIDAAGRKINCSA
jgi:hypothetical protein